MEQFKKVVVIGAGPSGLLSCKYLKGSAKIVCLEGREQLGGQWYREPRITDQQQQKENAYYKYYNTHFSSLYKGLRANLPYQLMTFKNFPHQRKYKSFFMDSEDFLEYLKDYTKQHELEQFIKFNSFVQKVGKIGELGEETRKKLDSNGNEKFYVQYCETNNTENISYVLADYVMVCNGHNIVPNMPDLENSDTFQGEVFHTHDLLDEKFDEKFAGKKVVLHGTRPSALDQVLYLCTLKNPPKEIQWIGFDEKGYKRMQEFPGDFKQFIDRNLLLPRQGRIKKYEKNSKNLILQDDTIIENVDVVIQATGFSYSYPFLNSNINGLFEEKDEKFIDFGIVPGTQNKINNKLFGPLYKRIFSVNEPNLIFPAAIERNIGSIQNIERSVIVGTQYVLGKVELPSKEDMMKSYQEDLEKSRQMRSDMKGYLQFDPLQYPERVQFEDWAKLVNIPFDNKFQSFVEEFTKLVGGYLMKGKFLSYRDLQVDFDYVPEDGKF